MCIEHRSGAESAGVLWTPFSTDRAGRRDRRCFFHGDWGAPKKHENLHKVRFKIAPYRGSRCLQRIGQTNSFCTSAPFYTYFCTTFILFNLCSTFPLWLWFDCFSALYISRLFSSKRKSNSPITSTPSSLYKGAMASLVMMIFLNPSCVNNKDLCSCSFFASSGNANADWI